MKNSTQRDNLIAILRKHTRLDTWDIQQQEEALNAMEEVLFVLPINLGYDQKKGTSIEVAGLPVKKDDEVTMSKSELASIGVITGDDALRFRHNMENVKPLPKEEIDRLNKSYEQWNKIFKLDKDAQIKTLTASLKESKQRIDWLEGLLKSAVYHVDQNGGKSLVELIEKTLENKRVVGLESLNNKAGASAFLRKVYVAHWMGAFEPPTPAEEQEAMDYIYDYIDTSILEGHYEVINDVLDMVNINGLSDAIVFALLVTTNAAKEHFLDTRPSLIGDFEEKLIKNNTDEKTLKYLQKLK